MKNLYKLNEYAVVINGGAWSGNEYSTAGIKVVKVTNMIDGTINDENISYLPLSVFDKYKAHILHTNDLVLATVGSHPDQPNSVVGKTATIPMSFDGAFLNQNAACIRVTEKLKVEPRYLKYLTKTVLFKHHVESRARGSANQVRLAISELKKFTYQFPHLPIQKKFAAILSAYDDLIENNNRRIAILEKMAEELYLEWFVRLRFPGHENVKIVKGVPGGWEVKQVREMIRFEKGKTPKILFIEKSEETDLYLNVDTIENNNFEYAPVTKSVCCIQNETLMLMDGARSSVVFHGFRGVVGSTFAVVRVELDMRFIIHEYLKANYDAMASNNTGSAIPHANKEFIVRMCIKIPKDTMILNKFNKIYTQLFIQKENIKLSNKILSQSCDRLLSRIMSGKIDVENMDIQFPASMRCAEPVEAQEEAVNA